MFHLGQLHQYGKGVERDTKTSFRLYKKAAQLGHAQAYSKCADFFYSKGDSKVAFTSYQRAAELGDINALNNLGLLYEQGINGSPEPEKALKYYKKAHNSGSSDGTINIAIYYLNGRFIQADTKIGKALLVKAYSNKNYRAKDLLMSFGLV